MDRVMHLLVQAIKNKQDLIALPNSFVYKHLQLALQKHTLPMHTDWSVSGTKQFFRNKQVRSLMKDVRGVLHNLYGVFQLATTQNKLLLQYKEHAVSLAELDNNLLLTHRSTKERIKLYPTVYEQLWSITGKPKKIVDLACGLNPCSYGYLQCTPTYEAYELSAKDCAFLNEYFTITKRLGSATVLDLTDLDAVKKCSPFTGDVCFLFKTLDSLEAVQRHITGQLLPFIQTTWIIISFPRTTLSGKKSIATNKRLWVEHVLRHLQKEYQTVTLANEQFFIIHNK